MFTGDNLINYLNKIDSAFIYKLTEIISENYHQ